MLCHVSHTKKSREFGNLLVCVCVCVSVFKKVSSPTLQGDWKLLLTKLVEPSPAQPLFLPLLCRLLTPPSTETPRLPAELSLPRTTFLVPEHLKFKTGKERQYLLPLNYRETKSYSSYHFLSHWWQTAKVMFFVTPLYNTELTIHYFKWHFKFLV